MKTAPSGFKIRQYYVAKPKRNKGGILYKIENHRACCLLGQLDRAVGITRNTDDGKFSLAETIFTSPPQLKLGTSRDKKGL